jgi:hypothetical protein
MRKKLIAGLFLCLIFFTVGCDNVSNQTEGTSELLGVSMYAEKNTYPSNVSEINVVWKNDTDKELTFGDYFSIHKLVGQEWEAIGNEELVFNSIGYIVSPHSEVKHSYNIRLYSEKLEEGTYRIVTDFSDVHSPGNYDTYNLTTSFKVK